LYEELPTLDSSGLYQQNTAAYDLGRGYIEARTDTTQQSGQTPDKEVEINP